MIVRVRDGPVLSGGAEITAARRSAGRASVATLEAARPDDRCPPAAPHRRGRRLAVLLALFGPVRFGVLAPVSWLLPGTRPWVYARASTIKLDLEHHGKPPRASQRTSWLVQEAACFLVVWSAVAAVVVGVLEPTFLLAWYLTFVGLACLDTARLLGAHRYLGEESDASLVLQMVDTVNYPDSRLAGTFWGAVGLRMHALHHLIPALPYHSYQEAHARLVAALPPDSAYRLTESPGLLASIRVLWRLPRPAGPQPSRGRSTVPMAR